MSRRALLGGTASAGAAGWLAGCTSTPTTVPGDAGSRDVAGGGSSAPPSTDSAPGSARAAGGGGVLLAYFSRAGENYHNGGRRTLEVGNTEVVAQLIAELTAPQSPVLHRIEPADPYPDSYDATVERNRTEQNDDARPGIANPLDSIQTYDTVILASPIWNVQAPMIMSTFTDGYDFTGKTVLPVLTYAVSGLSGVDRDYAAALPGARIGPGLAVRGEEVDQARDRVQTWLRSVGLTTP